MRALWRKLMALFYRAELDRDLDEEMRSHLEMSAEENRENGLDPVEARYAAQRQFGNPTRVQETSREMWGWRVVEEFLRDVRFALRMLNKNRSFTGVAVLTLALGIGGCTGVLSVVNAVLFHSLPYPDSERLMVLTTSFQRDGRTFKPGTTPADFLGWRAHSRSFEHISAARPNPMILTGVGEPHQCNGAAASFDLFRLLGVSPIVGRTFTEEDDRPGHDTVVMLDAGFWRREFGGDRSALGRNIQLSGKSHTVIGVLPPGFRFADFGLIDVWVPLAATPNRSLYTLVAVGRLQAGISGEAAQSEMNAVTRALELEQRSQGRIPTALSVSPFRPWVVGDVRTAFLLVLGAAVFVLLICCTNMAMLLLARAASRRAEIAIRRCLGAGRSRLLRQLLAESILLASLGGMLGLALATSIVRAVPSITALAIPRVSEIGVDWRTFAIAALLSLGSGILFGIAPVFEVRRAAPGATLKAGSLPGRGRSENHGLRSVLVVAQVALSLVLLSGTGLLLNSYIRQLRINLGFQPERLLTMNVPYGPNQGELAQEILARLRLMPGVQGASTCNDSLLEATHFPMPVRREGRPMSEVREETEARFVGVDYFRVAGIPLRRGREFEPADDARRPVAALINETAARHFFPGEDPIGKLLATGYRNMSPVDVVGVVPDTRQLRLQSAPGLQIYLPVALNARSSMIVRTSSDARPLVATIRAMVRGLAPSSPAPEIELMEERFDSQVALPRFYLVLFGAFALAGLLLAAVGTYGVISYSVAERTHEIGIRMALGGERAEILRMVVGKGLLLTGLGTALGLGGALALTRYLESLLYGVRPSDPLTQICAALVLAAAALLACYIPARRATKIDPMEALRYE